MVCQLLFVSRFRGLRAIIYHHRRVVKTANSPFPDHSRWNVRKQKPYYEGLVEGDHLRRK
jgi:hypothetical protein